MILVSHHPVIRRLLTGYGPFKITAEQETMSERTKTIVKFVVWLIIDILVLAALVWLIFWPPDPAHLGSRAIITDHSINESDFSFASVLCAYIAVCIPFGALAAWGVITATRRL